MVREYLIFDPEGDVVLVFGDEIAIRPQMLVSSKHLSLASPVFKAMLQVGFQEGQQLSTKGTVTIPLPEDCDSAFKILMMLVHAKYKHIPDQLILPTLTNLAVQVDKYQVHDCVGPLIIEGWVKKLENDHASLTGPDESHLHNLAIYFDLKMCRTFEWIAIAWVFRIPHLFTMSTKFAILHLKHPVSTTSNNPCRFKKFLDKLPIPRQVFDKINSRREQHLNTLSEALREARDHLEDPKNECCQVPIDFIRHNCRMKKLQHFNMILKAHGLNPLPEPPYPELSVKTMQPRLKPIFIDAFCGTSDHEAYFKDGKGRLGYFVSVARKLCDEEPGLGFQDIFEDGA
ncbi:hypothetical protein HYALB_00000436 [Hymenoscyphus albidus]|uniref:BTB domain-containing protein n=1 Tax=Hymenoscyphus albidus TaxID=595503 RepID=A0A9N9Q4W8_9HELO|nr:hypothetical protein HYALB_00000436 [Hymenoscyphus albidus]